MDSANIFDVIKINPVYNRQIISNIFSSVKSQEEFLQNVDTTIYPVTTIVLIVSYSIV